MCCYTHRTEVPGDEITFRLAEDENFRCQCGVGQPPGQQCPRRITGEDLRCDVCRNPDLWPVSESGRPSADRYARPVTDGGLVQWSRYPERWVVRETTPEPYPEPDMETVRRYIEKFFRDGLPPLAPPE